MFSPVTINGRDTGVQGLAPSCVHPKHQGQGIANQLVREGLEILEELGYPACVVLGDMCFYRTFGFLPAGEYLLTCPWVTSSDIFMGIRLNADGFSGKQGQVSYCAEFDLLMGEP